MYEVADESKRAGKSSSRVKGYLMNPFLKELGKRNSVYGSVRRTLEADAAKKRERGEDQAKGKQLDEINRRTAQLKSQAQALEKLRLAFKQNDKAGIEAFDKAFDLTTEDGKLREGRLNNFPRSVRDLREAIKGLAKPENKNKEFLDQLNPDEKLDYRGFLVQTLRNLSLKTETSLATGKNLLPEVAIELDCIHNHPKDNRRSYRVRYLRIKSDRVSEFAELQERADELEELIEEEPEQAAKWAQKLKTTQEELAKHEEITKFLDAQVGNEELYYSKTSKLQKFNRTTKSSMLHQRALHGGVLIMLMSAKPECPLCGHQFDEATCIDAICTQRKLAPESKEKSQFTGLNAREAQISYMWLNQLGELIDVDKPLTPKDLGLKVPSVDQVPFVRILEESKAPQFQTFKSCIELSDPTLNKIDTKTAYISNENIRFKPTEKSTEANSFVEFLNRLKKEIQESPARKQLENDKITDKSIQWIQNAIDTVTTSPFGKRLDAKPLTEPTAFDFPYLDGASSGQNEDKVVNRQFISIEKKEQLLDFIQRLSDIKEENKLAYDESVIKGQRVWQTKLFEIIKIWKSDLIMNHKARPLAGAGKIIYVDQKGKAIKQRVGEAIDDTTVRVGLIDNNEIVFDSSPLAKVKRWSQIAGKMISRRDEQAEAYLKLEEASQGHKSAFERSKQDLESILEKQLATLESATKDSSTSIPLLDLSYLHSEVLDPLSKAQLGHAQSKQELSHRLWQWIDGEYVLPCKNFSGDKGPRALSQEAKEVRESVQNLTSEVNKVRGAKVVPFSTRDPDEKSKRSPIQVLIQDSWKQVVDWLIKFGLTTAQDLQGKLDFLGEDIVKALLIPPEQYAPTKSLDENEMDTLRDKLRLYIVRTIRSKVQGKLSEAILSKTTGPLAALLQETEQQPEHSSDQSISLKIADAYMQYYNLARSLKSKYSTKEGSVYKLHQAKDFQALDAKLDPHFFYKVSVRKAPISETRSTSVGKQSFTIEQFQQDLEYQLQREIAKLGKGLSSTEQLDLQSANPEAKMTSGNAWETSGQHIAKALQSGLEALRENSAKKLGQMILGTNGLPRHLTSVIRLTKHVRALFEAKNETDPDKKTETVEVELFDGDIIHALNDYAETMVKAARRGDMSTASKMLADYKELYVNWLTKVLKRYASPPANSLEFKFSLPREKDALLEQYETAQGLQRVTPEMVKGVSKMIPCDQIDFDPLKSFGEPPEGESLREWMLRAGTILAEQASGQICELGTVRRLPG